TRRGDSASHVSLQCRGVSPRAELGWRTMSSSPGRVLTLALIGISAAAVAAMLAVTPASAHNVLVASTPSAGESLGELPDEFSVTTNEPMLALEGSQGFALQVRDEAGFYCGDGCVEVVDATMSAVAAPLGAS